MTTETEDGNVEWNCHTQPKAAYAFVDQYIAAATVSLASEGCGRFPKRISGRSRQAPGDRSAL